jgi:mannose-6-phosphate isomerase-like protein (cupin superfamily)
MTISTTISTSDQPINQTEYRHIHAGPMDTWGDLSFVLPAIPGFNPEATPVKGKQFFNEALQMDSMQISLNSLPPGATQPFIHRHQQNDELLVFIQGTGEFMLNQEIRPIQPGDLFYLKPSVERCWRNTGDVPLCFAVIQAKAGSLVQHTFDDGVPVNRPVVWPE